MRLSRILLIGVLAGLCLPIGPARAQDPVDQAIQATIQANRAAGASQDRIDSLDDQTRQLLERYRNASWQAQQLAVYADQLGELADAQEAERASLQRQIAEMERTEREILPLMLRMLDALDKLIAADLPFLQAERRERVDALRRLMGDPAVGLGEKFARLLEAYRIEAGYGRTLGAERAEVDGKAVELLRVGRTALYALSLDGRDASVYDPVRRQWQPLERRYRGDLRQGLKMAREAISPDLLTLPVRAVAGGQP
ncbi:MAG TPA: DUF3450 domain-containing protein [Nevskiaceae bacterium]|nr:DUF3450 domain-containing protein [Nevskiaceae bacterium]